MKKFLLSLVCTVCILFAEGNHLRDGSSAGVQTEKSKEKKAEYRPFQTDGKGFQTVSKEAIQEWKKTRRVALVAGSGDYLPNSKLSRLHFTSDDSHKMATVLRNVGQFDEIVLLNDEEGKLDSSRSAKKENILREFRRLLKTDPKTFLFYFSGHGFQLDKENVVAPVNADLTKKFSERNMLNVSKEIIDVAKFYKKLDKERKDSLEDADSEIPPDEKDGVPQIMVFLDACRDNLEEGKGGTGGLQSFTDFTLSSRLKNAKGVGVFLGTAPGEKSYEIKELNSGLFTHFLLEGISGGVQDRGVEYVTFNDLKLYVQEQMKAYSKKTGNKEQIPYSTGDYTGDFLVAVGRPAGKMKLDAVQYKFEGTERTDAKRAYDENGKILRLSFHNILSTGDVIPSSLEEISRISIRYNEKCFNNNGIQYGSRRADFVENCMTALQYDRQGNLDFQHGIRYIPDTGWEITRPYLDEIATKNAVRDPKTEGGIQYQRIIFDFNGNPILNEYHGENRKDLLKEKTVETLLADKEGIARIVQNFDVFSNRTLEEYYDAEKKLKPNADGIARKVFAYDSKGNPILELYMDETSGQKKIHSDLSRKVPKIYKTVYEYDYSVNEYGIIKSKKQFGRTEDIFVEGEDGLAKYEYEYSPDCLKFYSRTKEDAKKLNCIQSVSYRGSDEKYKGNDRNIALSKFTYNERGLLESEEYFRSSELPMVIRNGITKITYKYNEDCLNLLEPKLRTLKCRETDADCLKKEKLVNTCVNEISTFNTSGHSESDFDGIATYKYRYDKGCLIYIADKDRCITIETALDMKGNVVPVPKERKEEQFDENCLLMGQKAEECKTQVVTYGKDGRLKEDDFGVAKYVYEHNQQGLRTSESFLGINNELYDAKGKKYAQIRWEYDEFCKKARPKDLCVKSATLLNANGNLTENEDGFAKEIYSYNKECVSNKNANLFSCIESQEYYGADGNLKMDSGLGFAKTVSQFLNGKAIKDISFDESGVIITRSDSFYDRADRLIRTEEYNSLNELLSFREIQYDSNGYVSEMTDFDSRKNRKDNVFGFSTLKSVFDRNGNLLEYSYFDKEGKMKASQLKYGWRVFVEKHIFKGERGIAKYKFTYFPQGNIQKKESFDENDKKIESVQFLDYYNSEDKTSERYPTEIRKYNDQGGVELIQKKLYNSICLKEKKNHDKHKYCLIREEHLNDQGIILNITSNIFDSEGNYIKDEDVSHLIGTKKWTAAEDRFAFSEKMKDITEKELLLENGKQVEKEKKYSVITDASYSVQFPNPRGADGKKTVTVELDRFYRPGRVRFE